MRANTGCFFGGFKALQLEGTTAHEAISLGLPPFYLLVVWGPFFFGLPLAFFNCIPLHFPFLSLAHVLHGPPLL